MRQRSKLTSWIAIVIAVAMIAAAYVGSYLYESAVVDVVSTSKGTRVTVRSFACPWHVIYRPLGWIESHSRTNLKVSFQADYAPDEF
jgi:hypothetical protein